MTSSLSSHSRSIADSFVATAAHHSTQGTITMPSKKLTADDFRALSPFTPEVGAVPYKVEIDPHSGRVRLPHDYFPTNKSFFKNAENARKHAYMTQHLFHFFDPRQSHINTLPLLSFGPESADELAIRTEQHTAMFDMIGDAGKLAATNVVAAKATDRGWRIGVNEVPPTTLKDIKSIIKSKKGEFEFDRITTSVEVYQVCNVSLNNPDWPVEAALSALGLYGFTFWDGADGKDDKGKNHSTVTIASAKGRAAVQSAVQNTMDTELKFSIRTEKERPLKDDKKVPTHTYVEIPLEPGQQRKGGPASRSRLYLRCEIGHEAATGHNLAVYQYFINSLAQICIESGKSPDDVRGDVVSRMSAINLADICLKNTTGLEEVSSEMAVFDDATTYGNSPNLVSLQLYLFCLLDQTNYILLLFRRDVVITKGRVLHTYLELYPIMYNNNRNYTNR